MKIWRRRKVTLVQHKEQPEVPAADEMERRQREIERRLQALEAEVRLRKRRA